MACDFVDGVAAEFLEERVRQHQRHHRFAHHRGCGYGADVASLDCRGCIGERIQIDRPKRFHERRNRLHEARYADILAIGDATFEAAGAIPIPTALMAWIHITACASRPSSLRSHWT